MGGAVNDACTRHQIVIVEGFRAFHESGYRLSDYERTLTDMMKVRIWLEISKETCRYRRSQREAASDDLTLFEFSLWPCHTKYKQELWANVANGVTGPLFEIDAEKTPNKIFEEAMERIAPLLLTVVLPRNGRTVEEQTTPDRVNNPAQKIIKEGMLSKRSKFLKVWRRRWGVLTQDTFQTFKTQAHYFNGRPTEDFPLRHCLSAEPGMNEGDGYLMFLQIGGRKARMLQIKADTVGEREDWVKHFQNTLRQVAQNTTQGAAGYSAAAAPTSPPVADALPRAVSPQRAPLTGNEYKVVNALGSDNDGLLYRRSKNLEDKDVKLAPWNTTIVGENVGDGFVKSGHLYLPTELRGVPVLIPVQRP